MIAQASVDEVLNRADIIEIVGQFVRLRRRGANYIANCPFHNEKTPSFSVSASKGIFKCFGCGKGGNVVNFVMEHEKLTYVEAIRWLADFYKIALQETERSPEQIVQQKTEESLRVLNEFAAQYFQDTINGSEEGRAIGLSYFKQRGLRPETLEKFRLGYCPEDGQSFGKAATSAGYDPALMEKAGLIKERDGRRYDAYRGRVIFPIQSMTGRVLGFGARILKSNDKAPKYVNSPENELYVKSKVLYGMYQSRQAIGKLDECLLTEGYLDVIALHQAGVENAVASSGTSLTEDQLRIIGQLTKNLTILYDGDAAGIKAALRGMDMALSQSFNVKLVLLPQGEDPDSYIQKNGRTAFDDYVKAHKQDVISFRLEIGLKEAGDDPVKKSKLVNEVAESISRINKAEDFSLQQHYLREASNKLAVDEAGLINLVNKYIRDRIDADKRHRDREAAREPEAGPEDYYFDENGEPLPGLPQQTETKASAQEQQEWQLLRVLMEHGEKAYEGFASVAALIRERADPDLIETPLARRIFDDYFQYSDRESCLPPPSYFIHHPDTAIQQRSATILHPGNEISPNWKLNYGIESVHGEFNYVNDVDSTLSYFELKKIKQLQAELASKLGLEKDQVRLEAMMELYLSFKQQEKEVMQKTATVIVKG